MCKAIVVLYTVSFVKFSHVLLHKLVGREAPERDVRLS